MRLQQTWLLAMALLLLPALAVAEPPSTPRSIEGIDVEQAVRDALASWETGPAKSAKQPPVVKTMPNTFGPLM